MNSTEAVTRGASRDYEPPRPVVYGSDDAADALAPVLRKSSDAVLRMFRGGQLPAADLGHGQPGRQRRLLAIPAATIDRVAMHGPASMHLPLGLDAIRASLEPYPELMTAGDLSRALSIHRQTVFDLVVSGQIPAKRIGHIYVARRSVVARWLHGVIRAGLETWQAKVAAA